MTLEAAKYHVLHVVVEGTGVHRYTSPWSRGSRIELDHVGWTLTCPGCNGWIECLECREVPSYDDDSWGDTQDDEERELHGVEHMWRHEAGWVLPYPGCVISEKDIGDDVQDIALQYGPGDYFVEDDWWDTYHVTITAVSRADGSPLGEPDWAERQLR